jgi:DNA-binding transcriptional LysR family regulator
VAREATGRFRISYQPTLGGAFISRIASALTTHHPQSEIVFNAIGLHKSFDLPTLLHDREADMALVWSPDSDGSALAAPDLTVGPVLAEESRGVLVPVGHPLTEHSAVNLEDLRDYELLRLPDTLGNDLRDKWTPPFSPSGHPLKFTAGDLCRLTGRTELLDEDVLILVAQGRGLYLTMVSLLDRLLFPELAVVPIRDMSPMVVVPVWLRSAETVATRMLARTAADGPQVRILHDPHVRA